MVNISQIWALSDKFLRLQIRQYKTNLCQLLFPIACMITIYILQLVLDFVADQLTSATKRPEANIFPSSIPLINMLFILYSGISPSYLPKINPPTKFLFSTDTGINLGEFRSNGTQDGLLKNIMNMYISPFGTFTSHLNDSNGNIVPSIDILPSMKNAESRIFDEIYINKGSITDIGIINLSTWNTTLSSSEGLNYEFSYDNLSRTDFCNYVSRSSAAMNCHGWMENEMMNMLHQRYIYEATSKQLILQSNAKEMPFFQTEISFRLGDLLAYFFFPLILVLLLPVFMYHIVKEKETGVREMMYLMSMKTRNYVGVQYFFNYIIYILVALEFVLFAVIFKFKLIAETTPLLTFLTLSGWGFTLVSVSFFFSAFLHKTSFASILGYVFVIVSPSAAVVFQQHILCNRSEIEFTCPAAMKPFLLLFPLPLTHIIYSASTDCLKGKCPNKASDVVNNVELLWGILFLFLNGFIYLVLGLYFEKVLKQPTGVPKHPLFPLQYLWNFTIGRFFKNKQRKGSSFGKKPIIDQHENIDVKNMREKIQKQEITPDVCGVLVDGLVKTYKNNVAVKGVYLEVGFNENLKVMKNQKTSDQDKNIELNNIDENPIESNNLKPMKCSGVLGLLGENGAGKTSIIKILVGFQKASGGTAYIDGNCINGGFEPIYKSLGYCGQFDNSLWSDLTSYETLLFYARLKGVPFLKQRQHVIALLKSVGLWKDRNRSVSHLTSGLKRCLSIAISLIGNPSVVILDEPTGSINSVTAMQIWSLIIKEKKNRCFIITTHNMEEASAVSDQICIMAHGRIKAYGTNEHLKAVFGSGYELGIVLQESKHSEDCIAFIKELIPTSSLVHAFSEHLHFSIPKSDVILSKIFKDIESNKQNIGIKNWSLKSTTVEDVFINVVQAADQEHSEEQVKQTEKVTWWTRILSLVRMIYN